MAGNKYPESHSLILFVERAPFSDEEKKRLVDLLNANGMSEETTAEVHKALTALQDDKFKDDWQRARFLMDFNHLVKQWQMKAGSKKFKHAKQ